jgi:ubiquinone/menaquinone biosynthesis C-methylase UbiE
MSYFSLARRVPEASAVDPRFLAGLYRIIARLPVVRSVHRRFLAATLALAPAFGRNDDRPILALDVGAGPGYVAVELARRRPALRVIGLDLGAHMVAHAAARAGRAALDGRALWPQGDGHRLPFPDATFDLVVSSFALHHWRDPLAVLDEIARVLAPGGQYCIADVCREPNFFQRLFAYASIPAVSLAFGSYLGYGGYYESMRAGYTRAEARDMLRASALPPGLVRLDSTRFVPILTMASGTEPSMQRRSDNGAA